MTDNTRTDNTMTDNTMTDNIMTDNTMTKRKRTKGQTMIYKTINRNLMIDPQKTGGELK
jgi:hypothetical protein